MPSHKWTFKSHFRREAYGWKGTSPASKRMREAVSEIKKVGRKDPSLAGEGVVELFVRLYPALMQIDSSSGALGTAINKTVDALLPILMEAKWDMNTRGRWLDRLYEAIVEDGWGTFDGLRDYWGELCVYPGLAHLWADQFLPVVREVLGGESYSYFTGTDMCLSCLLYTGRYDELREVVDSQGIAFWSYSQFWAKALLKQGKPEQALAYAQQILAQDRTKNDKPSIDRFCESVLIEMGRIKEAYETYGLDIPSYGTYLNIYRGIFGKYPSIDRRKILLDCIERTGDKGKWFASAKEAGFLDIALECAQGSGANPDVLLRACRDFAEKEPEFAVQTGIQGIIKLITETFYEEVLPIDVRQAYDLVEKVAVDSGRREEFKSQLGKEIMRYSGTPDLREAVVRKLGEG